MFLHAWSGTVTLAEYCSWRQVCKAWNRELSQPATRKRLVLDLSRVEAPFLDPSERVGTHRWLRWLFERKKIGEFAEIATDMLLDWCEPWMTDAPLVICGLRAPFLQMRSSHVDDLQAAVVWAKRQAQIGTLFLGVWPLGPQNFKACGEQGEMEKIAGVAEGLVNELLGLLQDGKGVITEQVVLQINELFVEDPSATTDYVVAVLGFVQSFVERLGEGYDVVVYLDYRRDVKAGDVLSEDYDSDDEESTKVSWRDEYIGRGAWVSQFETTREGVLEFVMGDGMQYAGYVDIRVQVEAFSGVCE